MSGAKIMVDFLVAEDDPAVARALARALRHFGTTATAANSATAIAALDAAPPRVGLIADLRLADDSSGLDVLEYAAEQIPWLPALAFTAHTDADVINRVAALGAAFVCKAGGSDAVVRFARRALAASCHAATSDQVISAIAAYATAYSLSAREVELLSLAVNGGDRDQYIAAAGISPNTWKQHVRSLLRKCSADSMPELALDVLRGAVRASNALSPRTDRRRPGA